jgi:2-polyprenyl-3-methyl-5-hydroxy-6-metoxy-1,4-benzoquinol methylase
MYEHVMVRWLEAIAHNTERLAKAIEDITEAAETQLTASDVQQIIKHERLHKETHDYNEILHREKNKQELQEIQDAIDELKQSLVDEGFADE